MIWTAWRQQRTETWIALGVLALIAALFVPTGLGAADRFDRLGVQACVATPTTGACSTTLESFEGSVSTVNDLTAWFGVLPLLVAILFAAPLILELERRSYRLAWTQSITRRRWIATKLALMAVSVTAFFGVFAALMTWWRGPLDTFQGRIEPTTFQLEGVVPVAYGLFAAALVTAIGAIVRRIIPTVGIAIVAFLVVRIGIESVARPRFRAALDAPLAVVEQRLDSAWILTRDASSATYHPDGRFWSFQLIEGGIFLASSALLFAFAAWWMARRLE